MFGNESLIRFLSREKAGLEKHLKGRNKSGILAVGPHDGGSIRLRNEVMRAAHS